MIFESGSSAMCTSTAQHGGGIIANCRGESKMQEKATGKIN
jgi:hypothetical protein